MAISKCHRSYRRETGHRKTRFRMGGSNSRELSRRGSKRRGKKEKSPGQQEVPPTEHTPHSSYNDGDTRYLGFDGRHIPTWVDNPTDFSQFQENQWEDFSNHFEKPRDLHYGNRSDIDELNREKNENLVDSHSFHRPSSANDRYEERRFRRPIRRHHSFNENRFQFQSDEGTMTGFRSSQIRCNSLIDLNSRDFLFGGQYMGNRFTNFSSSNLSIQNQSFNSPHTSSTNNGSAVGHGGIKRYSCGNYNDDVTWDDSGEEVLVFDSPVKPRVKRRQSDESPSVDCLSGDNRKWRENERSHSGPSDHSNSTSNSDIPGSLPNEACPLDILCFPTEWSSFAVEKTGFVDISLSSPEGKSIRKFFQRTCKTRDCQLSISGIMRIENPFLHTLYLLKKEEMTVMYGRVDELFLYHGTKKRLVQNICENNLDWRQYSEMHKFGKGVSFSPSAVYSSHYSDGKGRDDILILFKVLVCNSVIGLPEMDIPPDDEGISCDTSIKEDASVIVKYCDNEFYPLYKIFYNKK